MSAPQPSPKPELSGSELDPILDTSKFAKSEGSQSTDPKVPKDGSDELPHKEHSRSNSTVSFKLLDDDDATTTVPSNQSSQGTAQTPSSALRKKDIIRPLFSRTGTTDKLAKPSLGNKTMTVETETVDASNAPTVTLPIASTLNISNSDMMSNNSTISNNLSSLRSKKSTLFVDQNSQIGPNNSSTIHPNITNNDDIILAGAPTVINDAASVNGSIRGFPKRLGQVDAHSTVPPKPGATKIDLFAAKIASAVGEASDSDSEETFVYESAPDALNTTHSAKVSSGNLNSNSLALRKISQRNISMPINALSATQLSNILPVANTPSLSTINDNTSTINITSDIDELDHQSLHPNFSSSFNKSALDNSEQLTLESHITSATSDHQLNANDQKDLLVESSTTSLENLSATKALADHSSTNQQFADSTTSLNQPKPRVFTKYTGENHAIKSSTPNLLYGKTPTPSSATHHSQLRTTTSKLFDAKGSSLRRYSGVPDDINIEDYIDQYDEEEEIGLDHYRDDYNSDDYEDEDNELTPLNVNRSNNNLRSKASRNYKNFGSTDVEDGFQDLGNAITKGDDLTTGKVKVKRTRNKSQNGSRIQPSYSPHNFHNSKKQNRIQALANFIYLFSFVFLLLTFGFVAGFLLATSKDLQDVSITSISDVVVSYDELVFDIYVEAFNPGLISISVEEIELDIFAKSEFLESKNSFNSIVLNEDAPHAENEIANIETILLGTISRFEVPLVFSSGLFNRNNSVAKGAIKLIHPGQNSTDSGSDSDFQGNKDNNKIENDSDKWRSIIKNPFELILKGKLKYDLLPFFRTERSVSVAKSVLIDPAGDGLLNS